MMFRASVTTAALWSLGFVAITLALLFDYTTAWIVGLLVAAAVLLFAAVAQSHILMCHVRRMTLRFDRVLTLPPPPPVPSQRVVAYSSMGVAQPALRVDPMPEPMNRDLLDFVQKSIDANGEHGTRFLSVALYKVANVPHVRYQQFMGLLGSTVTTQPYGRCVGCTLGELKQRILSGELR